MLEAERVSGKAAEVGGGEVEGGSGGGWVGRWWGNGCCSGSRGLGGGVGFSGSCTVLLLCFALFSCLDINGGLYHATSLVISSDASCNRFEAAKRSLAKATRQSGNGAVGVVVNSQGPLPPKSYLHNHNLSAAGALNITRYFEG